MKGKKIMSFFGVVALSACLMQSVFSASLDITTWPTLQSGSTGQYVKALQANLWSSGYSATVGTPDGSFGPNTLTAVKSFQTAKGLTADGSVGPSTKTKFQANMVYVDQFHRLYSDPSATTYQTYYYMYTDGSLPSKTYVNFYLEHRSTGNLISQGTLE